MCTASNALGFTQVGIQLVVNVLPLFIIKPPKKVAVFLGQDMVLNCNASGDPQPIISWKRCRKEIPRDRSKVTNGRLKLKHVIPSDSDVYSCVASGPFVKVETNVEITTKTGKLLAIPVTTPV